MARAVYWLTPPTKLTFIVSVALVILALLVRYAHVAIPVVSAHVFETLLIGYLVLLVGNLFRGLSSPLIALPQLNSPMRQSRAIRTYETKRSS